MSYKVGQILYVIPTKQNTVYPMQVVEEITKKTLNGTEIDYILKAGGTDPRVISHKDIQGEIFETADKARSIMIDRATRSIMKLVESAHRKAKEWYPDSFSEVTMAPSRNTSVELEQEDESMITLEDGTVARVKLPDILKE